MTAQIAPNWGELFNSRTDDLHDGQDSELFSIWEKKMKKSIKGHTKKVKTSQKREY